MPACAITRETVVSCTPCSHAAMIAAATIRSRWNSPAISRVVRVGARRPPAFMRARAATATSGSLGTGAMIAALLGRHKSSTRTFYALTVRPVGHARCLPARYPLRTARTRRVGRRAAPDGLDQLCAAGFQAPRVGGAMRLTGADVRDQAELGQAREQLRNLALVLDSGEIADRAVAQARALRDHAEHPKRAIGEPRGRPDRGDRTLVDQPARRDRRRDWASELAACGGGAQIGQDDDRHQLSRQTR